MNSKRSTLALASGLGILAVLATSAAARTGPGSSDLPYLVPVSGDVDFTSIFTVGDSVEENPGRGSSYRLSGMQDGIGVYDNDDGTLSLLLNHALEAASGEMRDHGARGAFASAWRIRKSDLKALNGEDLIKTVLTWDPAPAAWVRDAGAAFGGFGSADQAGPTALYNSRTGLGFSEGSLFLNGERNGRQGRVFAHVIQGRQQGWSYELPSLGRANWGDYVTSPYEQDKTVAIGLDDSSFGRILVYEGMKRNQGNPVELAGLHGGALHAVAIAGTPAELRTLEVASGTTFSLVAPADAAGTSFFRPVDGAWDTRHPGRFYFVTTDRYDEAKNGVGSQIGRSRLWRLNFTSIETPEAGGTVDLLLDGTEAGQMYGNLAVDGAGKVLLQEEAGGSAHIGKIWRYDPATDGLTLLARHAPTRFGDLGLPAAPGFHDDEAASGLFEVTGMLAGSAGYDTAAFRYFLVGVKSLSARSVPSLRIDTDPAGKGQILLMRIAR